MILDVDVKSLSNISELDNNNDDNSYQFIPTTNIQEIRILLARKMTAIALGASLQKTTKTFTQRFKKNIDELVTKQVNNNK